MAKTRVLTSFGASVAALAAAILIGVIGGKVSALPERITTAADSSALTAAPLVRTGAENYLVAGGFDGGAAITFLKFEVTLPEDRLPKRSWLWLGVQDGPLPELVELTQVPDTGWQEGSISGENAPRLGDVVASVAPAPNAAAIAFDVTRVVRSSGVYAFAVTAPTSTEIATFVAREAKISTTGAPTITLEWTEQSTSPSTVWNPPPFTPTPREPDPGESPSAEPSPSPSVSPWPSASPSVTATASVSPSPSDSPPPSPSMSESPSQPPSPSWSPSWSPSQEPSPSMTPSGSASPQPSASPSGSTSPGPSTSPTRPVECTTGKLLVPTCGALWGVAPGAHTPQDRDDALRDFESRVAKPQAIFHSYHRGQEIFPTAAEMAIARDPARPRVLFLNWKPMGATWAQIARGHPGTDAYLDRLADHFTRNFPEQFFFTMHHEPENEVREPAGSGMTAKDYAAAFRYVVKRLRADGVSNLVSTMCYMAYIPWNTKTWFEDLYPGDDVVDWVSWDIYAYSDPGYGYGDFAEMMNRRSGNRAGWPGFYNWAAQTFPGKPLMVAEWGVWYSRNNPGHHAAFFDSARLQLELFPRVKAYVYFESPDAEGRDSRVQVTQAGLRSFQRFSMHPAFDVAITRRTRP